jgi:hypothetical protein
MTSRSISSAQLSDARRGPHRWASRITADRPAGEHGSTAHRDFSGGQVQGVPARSVRLSLLRGQDDPHAREELLASLYPDIFPFESHAWRGGVTHPAFAARSPMVDHVRPGATGGDWASLENLVTACNPCNSIKADFELEQLGWELLPIANDGWDGLVSLYPALWRVAGEPQPRRHRGWFRDLGLGTAGALGP